MIEIARALVAQRQAISALNGITFSYDPQLATLDTYPRSLIRVRTPVTALRGFTVVPFLATEILTCDLKDDKGADFVTQIKLVISTIVAAPIYLTKACRIHSQDLGPVTLDLNGAAREAAITWAGFASWESY